MIEIVKVVLENEMDIILAHKQSMKLAELMGLSLTTQTSFATAVSEVARVALEQSADSFITLFATGRAPSKCIIAQIQNHSGTLTFTPQTGGYIYASRLVEKINVTTENGSTLINLHCKVPDTTPINSEAAEKWRITLNTDPSITPYEEIKRKNRLLLEITDKLKASETQYKTLTDTLPILIFSVSEQNEILYVNQWFKDYIDIPLKSLSDTGWETVIHPDDYPAVSEQWSQGVESQRAVKMEYRLKHTNTGEYRWHLGITTPLKDDNGKLLYWIGYLVDIQVQKIIEQTLKDNQELKETKAKLEEKIAELHNTNQRLEQFAYVASHDLQEPLRKISFYSDFLQLRYKDALSGNGIHYIDKLIKASERMRVLIKDVLAYSVIKREEENFEPVNLNLVAEDALHNLETAIEEKNAQVTINPLPTIEGNARQLKQVFENLISNSVKYCQADKIPQIHITAKTLGNTAEISFADNGIGFEDAYMDKMFDLFQRLHSADKYAGTGIGLAICKKIAETHNGHITAYSKGDGATFVVSLPISQQNVT